MVNIFFYVEYADPSRREVPGRCKEKTVSMPLKSVSNALRVLTHLQQCETSSVTELSDVLDLAPSTIHRLLATLQQHNYVEQTRGRRYRLGGAMRLSPDAAAIEHCIEIGYPVMERLRDASGETVHISILDGARSKFVAAVESPHLMRVTSRVGLTVPAHSSAAGKVLLAELTSDQLRGLYPYEHLHQVTNVGNRTRSALERELEEVKESGYGRNFGESEVGLAALAVPIKRPAGRPLCCLTLTGPLARFDPADEGKNCTRELELKEMLVKHASQIEEKLKY